MAQVSLNLEKKISSIVSQKPSHDHYNANMKLQATCHLALLWLLPHHQKGPQAVPLAAWQECIIRPSLEIYFAE